MFMPRFFFPDKLAVFRLFGLRSNGWSTSLWKLLSSTKERSRSICHRMAQLHLCLLWKKGNLQSLWTAMVQVRNLDFVTMVKNLMQDFIMKGVRRLWGSCVLICEGLPQPDGRKYSVYWKYELVSCSRANQCLVFRSSQYNFSYFFQAFSGPSV